VYPQEIDTLPAKLRNEHPIRIEGFHGVQEKNFFGIILLIFCKFCLSVLYLCDRDRSQELVREECALPDLLEF
jgi:hypothetical protein